MQQRARRSAQPLGGTHGLASHRTTVVALVAGCVTAGGPGVSFCEVTSPHDPVPESIQRILRGQRKSEVEAIIGAPDYSPTEGQYYHSTGGDCELVDADRRAPCGYILEYRGEHFDPAKGTTNQDRLESCSWGAIGE